MMFKAVTFLSVQKCLESITGRCSDVNRIIKIMEHCFLFVC